MSLTPTATANGAPPAYYPTVNSRMVCKDPKIFFFAEKFETISEPKFIIFGELSFHHYYVRNFFLIDNLDKPSIFVNGDSKT